MGLFSFGKQSSSQSSQSSSNNAAVNASYSASGSQGGSQSAGAGQSTSEQSIAFEELFAQLFGNASGAAATASQNVSGLQDQAGRLFSGGVGFLEQLQGGAGQDYLRDRVSGPDNAANAQLEALSAGLGDLFSEQLLPAISAQGVATGTLGGAREGVNTSMAAKEVAQQYSFGAADILASSQAGRDSAAGVLAGEERAGAAVGIEGASSLYGLAEDNANAGLSPYLALSQILGPATTLTQGQSTQESASSSFDIAQAISQALGVSYGSSQSSSTGKSKGFNFGFSPSPGVS